MTDADHVVLLAAAAAVTAVAATFVIVVVLRHNDGPNRIWAAGISVLALSSAGVAAYRPEEAAGVSAGAVAFAVPFAMATLGWGAALLNGLRPVVPAVGAAAAVATGLLTGLAEGSSLEAPAWALTTLLCAALCAVAAVLFGRGAMGPNLNALVLQAATGAAGLGFVGCAVYGLVAGEEVLLATLVVCGLLAVSITPNLTALRVERRANWWSMRDESLRRDLIGVLGRQAFVQDADDRLERSAHLGVDSALTLVRVDELAEINLAFGREAGDAALAHVAGVLRRHTRPWSLLGHLGGGVFAVLSPVDPTSIEAAVRMGLLHDPVPDSLPTRVEVSFVEVVSTPDDLAVDLLREAQSLLGPSASGDETSEGVSAITAGPED
ncbi:diguanylate cyclase [Nocardioides sp. zg-ZUI104]|uniref:diguanylate cyclase domain-containing protein n=1 Tax=Nocardioides faecalis TaxID=2803858 RepID=UPI001BD0F1A3|nr:diguanylate cyclase [Nocardioides faecalis]MBS4751764.1 diguanylate cyclase [Nocardioides faecalis]